MVPMLIGVPVALTPGLVPHDDVETDVALLELVLALLGALEELPLELALLLLLELLPQPASATSATAASSTRPNRTRGTRWVVLTTFSSPQSVNPAPRSPKLGGRY
jgi:hypothetical protein